MNDHGADGQGVRVALQEDEGPPDANEADELEGDRDPTRGLKGIKNCMRVRVRVS